MSIPLRYPTPADKLAALTRPTDDGHLQWTGPTRTNGQPVLCHGQAQHSAAGIAFTQHYGRQPIGVVKAACDQPGCLLGAHLDDTPARARLAAAMTALGV